MSQSSHHVDIRKTTVFVIVINSLQILMMAVILVLQIGVPGLRLKEAHFLHAVPIPIQVLSGKAEGRNAVLQNASDLSFPLENRDWISLGRELDGDGHACRSAADHGNSFVLLLRTSDRHTVKVLLRNIGLDARKMDRAVLFPPNAVPSALGLVIADDGADD